MRLTTRVALGVCAAGLVLWPIVATAGNVDEDAPPPDPDAIAAAIAFYTGAFGDVDLNEDGVPDFADSDGDGVPNVKEGFPGERDLAPGALFAGLRLAEDLGDLGFANVVDTGSSSTLIGDCGGMAMSFDDNGEMIDMAIGIPSNEGGGPTGQLIDVMPGDGGFGSRAFTSKNRFEVHVQGQVVYFGTLPRDGDGPREHDWEIKTGGISVDQGGDPNDRLRNRNAGIVDLGKEIGSALQFTGDFDMEAFLTSANQRSCKASGHIRFIGPFPLFTAVGAFATAFGALGVLGLLFNSRPAITWKA